MISLNEDLLPDIATSNRLDIQGPEDVEVKGGKFMPAYRIVQYREQEIAQTI